MPAITPARQATTGPVIEKVFPDVDRALEGIPDGATIMFGGFASAGSPSNLILGLKSRGTRGITGIANNIGLGGQARRAVRRVSKFARWCIICD